MFQMFGKKPIFRKLQKAQKLGLALGGGAALGAAHIGVLKYFEENNFL